MTLKVNGIDREAPDGSTVLSLLAALKLSPDKVAVEINQRLVKTENYAAPLASGDAVEIVTLVGGG